MLAIQGFYDGVSIKPKEIIPFNEEYEVLITFLKPKVQKVVEEKQNDIAERLAIAESLFGILPSTITDAEIKEARYKRYERNY
jgi:F0F1-type ATP synthase membrane subunit b/b'